MAGYVEGRASLPRIGARGLLGVVQPARRVHRAGAEQHVEVAELVLDRGDDLGSPALSADIVAGCHEGARQQPAAGELAVVARTLAQPWRVNRPGLAAQDHPVDGGELRQAWAG